MYSFLLPECILFNYVFFLSDLKRSNAIGGEINFAFEEEIDMIVTRLWLGSNENE